MRSLRGNIESVFMYLCGYGAAMGEEATDSEDIVSHGSRVSS